MSRHVGRRVGVENERHADASPVRPARRARDLGEHVGATRTARGEREHVLFGELGVDEDALDHRGVGIAQEARERVAIGAPREVLALTERQGPSPPVVGDLIVLGRAHLATVHAERVADEAPERQMRNARGLLAEPLDGARARGLLERVDERDQHLPRDGIGLLGAGADDLEHAREIAHVVLRLHEQVAEPRHAQARLERPTHHADDLLRARDGAHVRTPA